MPTSEMDGLDYYEDNNTNRLNSSEIHDQDLRFMICGIIGILLLVPALILQLYFMYRYKSTFLHRQFLYTTIVVILLDIIYTLYPSSFDTWFFSCLDILNQYLLYVEGLQITTIHLLLLYKLCKHMQTRTTQRLHTLCCNIRPRPYAWHDVIIVCIQFGLPLPLVLVIEIVMTKTSYILPIIVLAVNILLGMICIVLLVLWFYMLWKRKLLKSKAKFVCTQMGHILFVLAVFFIFNLLAVYLFSSAAYFNPMNTVLAAMQTVFPVSIGVYILISLRNKVTTKAQVFVTNRHTNPPSTRVSLPTDTAEHAPNFLSPSTAEPSEVTPLVNI